jgi:hypothetical protein
MKNENLQLLPPGTPLPLLQRLLLRLYLGPFKARKAQWQTSRSQFEKVSAKSLVLLEEIPRKLWDQKILVPPQKGLEDSSRCWSINETLEHMVIVGMSVAQIMKDLGANKDSSLVVNTAAAKPKGKLNAERAHNDYVQFLEHISKDLDSQIQNRQSKKTCLHPWFGQFGVSEWNWLLGMHQSIHYIQLKNIVKGLNQTKTTR